MVGMKRTRGVAPRRTHDAKRVGSTVAKVAAGARRRKKAPVASSLRARRCRSRQQNWEKLVTHAIQKWTATPESEATLRRLKTAARAKGSRPLSHNIFELLPNEDVMVLTGVKGKKREGVWMRTRILAVRKLQMNHSKLTRRQCVSAKGIVQLPSSAVVVEDRSAKKRLRRDTAYVRCVHDWQVVPFFFWGKRSYALAEVRAIRRKAAGKSGLADEGDMLSQDNKKKVVKVKPRARCVLAEENWEDRFMDEDD